MMNHMFSVIIAIIAFTIGYIVAEIRQSNNIDPPIDSIQTNVPTQQTALIDTATHQLGLNLKNNVLKQTSLSLQDQEKLLQLLNHLPSNKIEGYLNQAFPDQDFEGIKNKKVFAERLLEELNKNKAENKNLTGEINFSTSSTTPNQSMSLNQINSQQYIYAHFDTFGRSPPNTQVFIKWVNQDTQEVVLFAPKYIQSDSQQNWVSAVPAKGWGNGTYSVTFYQMTDTLIPIAQSSFTLSSVIN